MAQRTFSCRAVEKSVLKSFFFYVKNENFPGFSLSASKKQKINSGKKTRFTVLLLFRVGIKLRAQHVQAYSVRWLDSSRTGKKLGKIIISIVHALAPFHNRKNSFFLCLEADTKRHFLIFPFSASRNDDVSRDESCRRDIFDLNFSLSFLFVFYFICLCHGREFSDFFLCRFFVMMFELRFFLFFSGHCCCPLRMWMACFYQLVRRDMINLIFVIFMLREVSL